MRLKLYRGYWCATWREGGNTRRVSLRTDDKAEALRRLSDLQRQPVGETVSDILTAYETDKAQTVRHADSLKRSCESARKAFGAYRPDQITRQLTRAYVKRMQGAGLSNGTIIKHLGALKAALRWHEPHTPAVIEMPSAPPSRERFLSHAEYDALLAATVMPHVRLFVVLALATAARKEAILQLTWGQIDFENGLIRLGQGHGNKRRATVPMTEDARQALQEAQRAAVSDFVVEYAGGPVKSIKRGFGEAVRRAGIDWCSPHDLRRTAATWMIQRGIPIEAVAQYLGHTDTKITFKHYAKFSPDYLRDAARALEKGGRAGSIEPESPDVHAIDRQKQLRAPRKSTRKPPLSARAS